MTVRAHIEPRFVELLEDHVDWDPDGDVCLSDGFLDAVPTVIVSDDDPDDLVKAGFAGVVRRGQPPERILAAIDAVRAGFQVVDRGADAGLVLPTLTAREYEALELLARGYSNREIGESMGISAHTAKFHVQAILDKLDATTRTEAAVRATRLHLI